MAFATEPGPVQLADSLRTTSTLAPASRTSSWWSHCRRPLCCPGCSTTGCSTKAASSRKAAAALPFVVVGQILEPQAHG